MARILHRQRIEDGATKSLAVSDGLRRDIVIGTLAPGAKLVELELAERFGCSQSSVREALFRLHAEGLVWRERHKGTFVSTTRPAEARELVAIRRRLEPEGARHAVPRLEPAQVDELAEHVLLMEAMADEGDLYGMSEADRHFHLTLFEAAELPVLMPILARCFSVLHRFTFADPGRRRTPLEAASRHWPIVEAARKGDAEATAAALDDHIANLVLSLSTAGNPAP